MAVTRHDIAKDIAGDMNLSIALVEEVLKRFVEQIQIHLVAGREIQLRGLFRLRRVITPARGCNLPGAGKETFPEHGRVEVRIMPSLRARVR